MKKTSFNTRAGLSRLSVCCVLALSGMAVGNAADINPKDTGYLTDTRGAVVKSGFGLCWHTGTGPAAPSTPECDPDYVAPKPVVLAAQAAPAAAVAAPTPASSKLRLSADTLFDFDKAVLRPAARRWMPSSPRRRRSILRSSPPSAMPTASAPTATTSPCLNAVLPQCAPT